VVQTDLNHPSEFIACLPKTGQKTKGQNLFSSAQSLASCQRSGRSPALPYPPHECFECTILSINPFLQKGTSLLCKKGDISTLH
jgi:hypothetical protein